MTTHQVIAMLFPVGATAAVGLAAWVGILCLNRRYPRQTSAEAFESSLAERPSLSEETIEIIVEKLTAAESHIQAALRELRRAS